MKAFAPAHPRRLPLRLRAARCLRRVSAPRKPNPDRFHSPTQRLAYESGPDIIASGTAGWGKTDLMLVGRKQTPPVGDFPARPSELAGDHRAQSGNFWRRTNHADSFNESFYTRWSLDGGRGMLEFEACQTRTR